MNHTFEFDFQVVENNYLRVDIFQCIIVQLGGGVGGISMTIIQN